MAYILVVDDEPSIADFVQMALGHDGFEVVVAADGPAALERFAEREPQLVILDWMLPGLDGLEVCRRIRRSSRTIPILMLTARGDWEDKVQGLDSGADDYLAKPFKMQELLARVRALLRRSGGEPGRVLSCEDVSLDTEARRVTRAGRAVELTGREFELLEALMRSPGKVVSRDALLSKVWGYDFDGNPNVVEVHLSALRTKLGDTDRTLLRTVRGVGYALG